MKLGIIVASTRPTRVGHLIGQWVHERAVELDSCHFGETNPILSLDEGHRHADEWA